MVYFFYYYVVLLELYPTSPWRLLKSEKPGQMYLRDNRLQDRLLSSALLSINTVAEIKIFYNKLNLKQYLCINLVLQRLLNGNFILRDTGYNFTSKMKGRETHTFKHTLPPLKQ